MGDGTYSHSGILSVRAAVAAGVHMTFKLLANSTVAMTGGQPIPSGRGLDALVASLLAEGVSEVLVTSDHPSDPRYRSLPGGVEVWDRRRLLEAQVRLAEVPGVSVLLHDQGCAAENRRRRRRGRQSTPRERVVVNPLVCEGCGDCGALSNCLSVRPVETARGRRVRIHQESCNFDYSCLDADCPALVTVAGGRPTSHRRDLPEPPEPRIRRGAMNLRLVGVGGTGVLTVAQVLAVAAHLEGRTVRSLDQTGIAQKGGPVVSDLRVDAPEQAAARLGAGECDLYLSFDPLVGADGVNLSVCDPGRTSIVATSSLSPTGREVADIDLRGPEPDTLAERLASRSTHLTWLDAAALSRQHLGSDEHANVLLLGVALQSGLLPVGAASLERALELNGVALETNLAALTLGRLAALGALEEPGETADAPSARGRRLAVIEGLDDAVRERLALRFDDLYAFGRGAPIARVIELVHRCAAAEVAATGSAGPFTEAAAQNLVRLFTPKDEYEVARLHRSRAWREEVEAAGGSGAQVTFHLRPLRRSDGHGAKWALRRGAGPALAGLAAMRHVRGTALDPLRARAEHREARALAEEYASLIERLAGGLGPDSLERSTELAASASLVRGFAQVRARGQADYRRRRQELGEPVAAS